MTSTNPFNFIDPLLLNFPANKTMYCPKGEEVVKKETFFNSKRKQKKQNWAYDNYFFREDTFDGKRRRDDRTNIEVYMKGIHEEEKLKSIPTCTQSQYGHRTTNYGEKQFQWASVYAYKEFYRPNGMSWPKQIREEETHNTNNFKL